MSNRNVRSLLRTALTGATLTLATLTIATAAPAADVAIRWATIENASQSFFPIVIKERGIDAKYGLDVKTVFLSQTQAQWTSLRSGDADISTGSVLDLMRQRNAGLTVKAVAPFLTFSNPVVALADKPYTKLSDLRGLKIGTPSATLFDWMILRAAAKRAENFDLEKDAEVQTAAPGLLNSAMEKGDIAAALQFSDFTLQPLSQKKYKLLTTVPRAMAAGGLDPESSYLNFNLHEDWIAKNQALVKNVVAAIEEARKLMLTDDSIWPPLAKRAGVTDASLLGAYMAETRASMMSSMAPSKLAATQALFTAITEAVGATAVGVRSFDNAAFDFPDYEAGKALVK